MFMRMRRIRAHASAMADMGKDSSLFQVMNNMESNTLKTHTNLHTFRGRPSLKDVDRFRNRSVRELYERSIYERSFTSELSIENHAKLNRGPSRMPVTTLKRLMKKNRTLKEFVYERIRPSIPKSSRLRCYLKVSKLTKDDCNKLNIKLEYT